MANEDVSIDKDFLHRARPWHPAICKDTSSGALCHPERDSEYGNYYNPIRIRLPETKYM
jgi:hypothetical protein